MDGRLGAAEEDAEDWEWKKSRASESKVGKAGSSSSSGAREVVELAALLPYDFILLLLDPLRLMSPPKGDADRGVDSPPPPPLGLPLPPEGVRSLLKILPNAPLVAFEVEGVEGEADIAGRS